MNTTQTAAGAERIDAVEVQERLDWQAMRAGQTASITIDTATLDFLPNGPHQVAAMANLGAELLQEIQAYRPQFLFKSSPAEIVGALIEETAAPSTAAAPAPMAAAYDCWSCRKPVTLDERSNADGDCPHCGSELDLDLWPDTAAPAAQVDTKDAKLQLDAACRSLEHYADSYERMGRIGNDGKVECTSVAYDIRRNMVDAVRAAFAVKAGA